jgi:hypothetical protein
MDPTYDGLLESARRLQEELELFAAHVRSASHGSSPVPQVGSKLATLRGDLQTEVDFLEREREKRRAAFAAAVAGPAQPDQLNGPSGSNLLFFEALWDTAKHSADIFDLRQKVCADQLARPILGPGRRIVPSMGSQVGSKFRHVLVDLVTDGGRTWVKISTVTNRRLLFDLAKEAVYGDSSDEEVDGHDDSASSRDHDDETGHDGGDDKSSEDTQERPRPRQHKKTKSSGYTIDEDLDIPLLKLSKELAQAAANYRIRTRHPRVRLVLPRIKEHETPEVDQVLKLCRQTGAEVLCSDSLSTPTPMLSASLQHTMYPDPRSRFSRVLNVDTSVIVALTSDFSHSAVQKQYWFDRQRIAHCEQETKEHFLPDQVYPLIESRDLVCVREAAETYRHIVDTIGTPTEKARAKLILGGDDISNPRTSQQLVAELRELSIHPIPSTLRLPVSVVDGGKEGRLRELPQQAIDVLESQLNPGRSVFSYGWATGLTTITCNGVATKQLALGLEKFIGLGDDDVTWPSMWACSSSRPLLGVPKAAWARKHIGDCTTNGCTCGVEKFHGTRDHGPTADG